MYKTNVRFLCKLNPEEAIISNLLERKCEANCLHSFCYGCRNSDQTELNAAVELFGAHLRVTVGFTKILNKKCIK